MAEPEFTAADFHALVHKQVVNAAFETLANAKLDWGLVAPFLEAAHEICRGDFREGARIRLHATLAECEETVEAEEAYLAIAVADREDGQEWLSESYWLSDIVRADGDPEEARRILAALERSAVKVKAWLAEMEQEGPDGTAPPEPSPDTL